MLTMAVNKRRVVQYTKNIIDRFKPTVRKRIGQISNRSAEIIMIDNEASMMATYRI